MIKFKGFSIENLVYDVCERASHKRHSYCSENVERRKEPIHIIHYDVWGLAPSIDIHVLDGFLYM